MPWSDNWDPESSPITTNDAIGRLFGAGALGEAGEITAGIVRYLTSGDSFDKEKQRWLFAVDSNQNHPHAIWWEKTATASLAGIPQYPWRHLKKEPVPRSPSR